MDDELFTITESKAQGAIRWQKRALAAERTARLNANACDVHARKNDELKYRVAEMEKENAKLIKQRDGRQATIEGLGILMDQDGKGESNDG